MADIRVQIPDAALSGIQEKLSIHTKPTDITRDAPTLYDWAVEERAKGRVLLTTDAGGENPTRLEMPSLQSVKPNS